MPTGNDLKGDFPVQKAILSSWITVVHKIGTFCAVYYAKKGK